MLYAKIVDDEVVEWPLHDIDLKERHSEVSLPEKPSTEDFESLGYVAINPLVDIPISQDKDNIVVLGDLEKDSDGNWVRTYVLSPITNENEKLARLDRQWALIRQQRDTLFKETDWRVLRSLRESTLELTPTEDISVLEQYRDDLANITDQDDPFNIIWPEKV